MTRGLCADPVNRKLTRREEQFARGFVATGNRLTAYKEAGYRYVEEDGKPANWILSAGRSLASRPCIARRIAELQEERRAKREAQALFAIEFIRDEHARLAKKCEDAGDMTNATRNLEDLGRTVGAYSDGVIVDVRRTRTYSEAEQAEARRLAAMLLDREDRGAALPGGATGDGGAEGGPLLPPYPGSQTPDPPEDDAHPRPDPSLTGDRADSAPATQPDEPGSANLRPSPDDEAEMGFAEEPPMDVTDADPATPNQSGSHNGSSSPYISRFETVPALTSVGSSGYELPEEVTADGCPSAYSG